MKPKCPYFASCGGCQLQNQSYKQQLADKEKIISQLFQQDVPITAHPHPFHYRNKMDFVAKQGKLGLRGFGSFDQIVDIQHCAILSEQLNEVYMQIRLWFEQHKEVFGEWLRYVVVRGETDVQVIITTANADHADLIDKLHASLSIASLVWTTDTTSEQRTVGDVQKVFGSETIVMSFSGKSFTLDATSFFQASTAAMELVIDRIKQVVPVRDTVVDMFCGVGSIGIALAPKKLIGVEMHAPAVTLATQNAKKNGVSAEFLLPSQAARIPKQPDLLVVDPPRTGLGTSTMLVRALQASYIAYLSCNPASQRKDLAALKGQYEVIHVEAFDFFPQTSHVENLVVLQRKS